MTFTWLLLHERYEDSRKGAAVKRFVDWTLTDGQGYSADMGYIPLPDAVATTARVAVNAVQ